VCDKSVLRVVFVRLTEQFGSTEDESWPNLDLPFLSFLGRPRNFPMPKPYGEKIRDLCDTLGMPAPRRGSYDDGGCSMRDGTEHGPKGKPWLPHELIGQPEGGHDCEHVNAAATRLKNLCINIKTTDANRLTTSLGSTSVDLEEVIAMFWARRARDDSKDAMLCADPKHKGNKRLHLVSKTHAQCAACPFSAMIALFVIPFLTAHLACIAAQEAASRRG
jgi:hypothetical protein